MWHSNTDGIVQWMKCMIQWEWRTPGSANFRENHFGEIMPHFIIGLDEMCLMSDCHGNLRVFAASDKKKQEKLFQDCHCSITVVRMGTVAGTTGPTMFLLKGAKCRKHFNNDYLLRYGMAPGSKVIMTENAYMTDEAWLEASKSIVDGYRQLPYIKENEDWYIA